MKTIKFLSDNPREKEFASALRKNVMAYFKDKGISSKGNSELYVKAASMLLLYLLPFIFIVALPLSGWPALVLVVLMGIGEAGIGMAVMHDASHGSFSSKKWVNELFSSTMFLLGSNTLNWKIQHIVLHHTFTNISNFDQDIETKAVLRLCEHMPLKFYHRFQYLYAYFFYGLMTLSKLVTDVGQLLEFNRAGITADQGLHPGKEMLKLILSKLIYIALIIGLPLWISDFTWWEVLLGFCILHFTAGIIMSTIFQMAHVVEGAIQPLPDENGVIHSDWLFHQLSATSDFGRGNRLLTWYSGGLNYQIEHHLFPNICHIHYPEIAPIVEQTARDFGFVYNLKPGLFAAFLSHARRLKELGRSRILLDKTSQK